jgi:dTDP-4-dehydrorhamnose 3,5-epimerase
MRAVIFSKASTRALAAQVEPHAIFVPDNHSRSVKGVLRGLHDQVGQAQGKHVRVVEGDVSDVAVDLRRRCRPSADGSA